MGMTVLELMRSDRGLVTIAEMMHARFGCPGKNYPCNKIFMSGKKICEGCWINYLNTQVPEKKKEKTDETSEKTNISTEKANLPSWPKMAELGSN